MIIVNCILVVLAVIFVVLLGWVIISPIADNLRRIADVMEKFDIQVEEVKEDDA